MMFFFFQAEDGIRDGHVTGVQTCALPIYGVPVAQDQRMDAGVFEPELDGVDIGDRRLAAGDIDRIASRAERRDKLAERQIGRASCRERVVMTVDGGIGKKEEREKVVLAAV